MAPHSMVLWCLKLGLQLISMKLEFLEQQTLAANVVAVSLNGVYRFPHLAAQRKDDNSKIVLVERQGLPGIREKHSCQFLKEMLNFYLKDVILAAKTNKTIINKHISRIGNALHELNENVQNCHHFFNCELCSCNRSSYFKNIHQTFKQLQIQGVYKAMGELNAFFDWIWNYINLRRRQEGVEQTDRLSIQYFLN
ncbi:interleukin-10-like [Hypanus sabinus]|uniref:interleukin-10-like n=1 Tax=Hypanus sabinus TaxID=79690 RepID=UPI0028C3EB49|nr:interleukin-10-like [Hypanus sabinus]